MDYFVQTQQLPSHIAAIRSLAVLKIQAPAFALLHPRRMLGQIRAAASWGQPPILQGFALTLGYRSWSLVVSPAPFPLWWFYSGSQNQYTKQLSGLYFFIFSPKWSNSVWMERVGNVGLSVCSDIHQPVRSLPNLRPIRAGRWHTDPSLAAEQTSQP